jgi:hypothetical protein
MRTRRGARCSDSAPRGRAEVGAQLLEFYGNVPLAGNLGLGIAVMSYNGKLFWGFNADWEIVPDVHDFVETTATAFGELRAAAGVSSG